MNGFNETIRLGRIGVFVRGNWATLAVVFFLLMHVAMLYGGAIVQPMTQPSSPAAVSVD